MALQDSVSAIVEAARVNAGERGVAVSLHAAPQPLLVSADQVRIEQIVWNLLSNATKFTPAGGRVEVSLDADEGGHRARLTVADSGCGIAPEFLPQIFEMFSQEGQAAKRGGRGLGIGLALVRELVAAHGGDVTAESDGPGKGARFTVRLPLVEAGSNGRARVATAASANPLQGIRVLLVDDSAETLELFAELLQMEGAEVDSVTSAGEALEGLAGPAYDLLVSDLGMPGMSGYELLTRLRQSSLPNRNVFAIALSGYSREADVDKAVRAGFQLHLSKPTSVDDVKKALLASAAWKADRATRA
jgi:two-component system CheB/CheR fusion protein